MTIWQLITNKWPILEETTSPYSLNIFPRMYSQRSPRMELFDSIKNAVIYSKLKPIFVRYYDYKWKKKASGVHRHNSTPGLVTNKCIQCYGLFFRSLAKPHVPELCPKCYNKIRGL